MVGRRVVDEIDQHIGKQLRLARKLRGMTMTQLGALVGVSYQQLQKYEMGHNRVSAASLWIFARRLQQPLDYFYLGLEATNPIEPSPSPLDPECFLAAQSLSQISNPSIRATLTELIQLHSPSSLVIS